MGSLYGELLALGREIAGSDIGILEGEEEAIDEIANAYAAHRMGEGISSFLAVATLLLGPDRVVTPRSASYGYEKERNWSQTCHLPAKAFLRLATPSEVVVALRLTAYFNVPFGVRSGGGNPNPGFGSAAENAVVLDLSLLNGIQLNAAKDIVSIGPGATWGTVYEYLEGHELTVVGGRVDGAGVGGVLSGGGMSHYTNHWGLGCDNVTNFEVALPDRLVQANVHDNQDLFRALKGGGSNFGIVTRFDLITFPEHRMWYQYNIYAASDCRAITQAAVQIEAAMETDDRLAFFLVVASEYSIAGLGYRGWSEETPKAFAEALAGLEPLNIAIPATNGTHHGFSQAAAMPHIMKRACGTLTVKSDAATYADFAEVLYSMGKLPFGLQFALQPVSGRLAVEKARSNGGNMLNIPPERQAWLGMMVQWTEDAHDEQAQKSIQDLIEKLETKAGERGTLLDFQFLNDASFSQDPIGSYGLESVEFMWQVSRKFDPEQVFQNLQSGGFLLSRRK